MTDYYSLIAEAVTERREQETRIIIYERARAALRELHKRGRLTSAELVQERAQLDEAISNFEADEWRRQRDLNQLRSVLAEVTREKGPDATPAAPVGTEANSAKDVLADAERRDPSLPESEPTVATPPAQSSPRQEASEPDVIEQPDVAAAHASEATTASEETSIADDVANSGAAKPSTGGDAIGSDPAPSVEQVVSSDFGPTVDQAVAEADQALVEQADPCSHEQVCADIDDTAPTGTPADQRPTDTSGVEQTAPDTPSPATDESNNL